MQKRFAANKLEIYKISSTVLYGTNGNLHRASQVSLKSKYFGVISTAANIEVRLDDEIYLLSTFFFKPLKALKGRAFS